MNWSLTLIKCVTIEKHLLQGERSKPTSLASIKGVAYPIHLKWSRAAGMQGRGRGIDQNLLNLIKTQKINLRS